jgi:hypothetical protein
MAVTELAETDLELLESYLDDELSSLEHDALEQRLSREPALAAALDDLRAQGELRRNVIASFEPNEAMVQRVLAGVDQKVENHMVWTERARSMRWLSGVAATLLIGFLGGYIFRGGPAGTAPGGGGGSNTAGLVATNGGTLVSAAAPVTNIASPGGTFLAAANGGSNAAASGPRELIFPPGMRVPSLPAIGDRLRANNIFAGYEVAVTDEAGNIIGVQRFPTLQEAQEFRNDLSRLQQQKKQLQNGGVKLIGADF